MPLYKWPTRTQQDLFTLNTKSQLIQNFLQKCKSITISFLSLNVVRYICINTNIHLALSHILHWQLYSNSRDMLLKKLYHYT